jgi:hypothetical protein
MADYHTIKACNPEESGVLYPEAEGLHIFWTLARVFSRVTRTKLP